MDRAMVRLERFKVGPYYLDAWANGSRRRGEITGFVLFTRRTGSHPHHRQWVGGWEVNSHGGDTWGPRVENGRLYGIVEVADLDEGRESFLLTGGTLMGILGDLEVALVSNLSRDYDSDVQVLNVNKGRLGYYIYDGAKRLARVREWNLKEIRRALSRRALS